jgi:hypothetical protein
MPRFEHDLRVRLKERRNRLYKTDFGAWDNEATLMLAWMWGEPYLAALLSEIGAAPFDVEQWKGEGVGRNGVDFPNDETQRAKVCLALFAERNVRVVGRSLGGGSNFNDMCEAFVRGIVDPLVYFLEDRIEDGSALLGILERYKHRTEWFHQHELHSRYHAETARGEATLDGHLREYLVDQGIAFPFSQPSSPSGEADVVSLGEDPLALEIKLFAPDAGKDRAYIRQGFAQAYRYAADYGLPAGYLVVFNLTPASLVFATDHPGRWPATITVGERAVFCITVDANTDRPSASKDRMLARTELDKEFLLVSAS